jgi:hypothetical protein
VNQTNNAPCRLSFSVLTRRKRFPVWLRAGQHVVHVGRVATAIDHRALLGQSRLLRKHVGAMQFVEVAMSVPLALYQGPWPMRSRAFTAGTPALACVLR